jgi:ADP-heptose:LPS heptosyltransferase
MRALLVAAGGGLGDTLLASPLARALRTRYDEVDAVVLPAHRGLAERTGAFDEVFDDSPPRPTLVRHLREQKYDAAVVTWATLHTATIPFAAGIPIRVGQARRLYSPLFTHRVTVRSETGDRTTHWTQILLDYTRAIDCDLLDATPTVVPTAGDEAQAQTVRASNGVEGAYAMLHPTRGLSHARDRWPTSGLAALARSLRARYGIPLLISGGVGDVGIAARVGAEGDAISIAGTTGIGAFAALARDAQFVVAMDSGPMHVAAAMGVPTVGLFVLQSDEPDRWAPLGPHTAVVRASYPCPVEHRKETCPDFPCVREIDVPAVLRALDGLPVALREA